MQYSNNKIFHSIEFENCDLSNLFLMNDVLNHDSNTGSNNNSVNSSKRTISINDCIIIFDNNINASNSIGTSSSRKKEIIHTTIRNCTMFSSWDISDYPRLHEPDDSNNNNKDIVLVLNALSHNEYIQSLHIRTFDMSGLNRVHRDITFNAITNVVTFCKNLSKLGLVLHTDYTFEVSKSAVSNFVNALVQSKKIVDLSFEQVGNFRDKESMHIIHSLFDRKENIQKLQFDSILFLDEKKYCHFNASIFSKLFTNNNYQLRELDVNFFGMNDPRIIQQLLLFIALLKESCIEKLTIRFDDKLKKYLNKELFVNVIPFMKKLQCLQFGDNFYEDLIQIRKCVGICNRTLSIVKLEGIIGDYGIYQDMTYVQEYLERNEKITNCIVNKIKCKPRVLPKLFTVTKLTGPDATYQILNYLDLSTGPRGKGTLVVV